MSNKINDIKEASRRMGIDLTQPVVVDNNFLDHLIELYPKSAQVIFGRKAGRVVAVQFTSKNWNAYNGWFTRAGVHHNAKGWVIDTRASGQLESSVPVVDGDWIVFNGGDNYFCLSNDKFSSRYEHVDGQSDTNTYRPTGKALLVKNPLGLELTIHVTAGDWNGQLQSEGYIAIALDKNGQPVYGDRYPLGPDEAKNYEFAAEVVWPKGGLARIDRRLLA